MDLRTRLENATERAVLFQIIKDVVNDPTKYKNVVEAFCVSIDCFSKFLTDKEFFTALIPVLDTQCPMRSIIGFSRSMSFVSSTTHQTSFRDVMTVLQWLKYVVQKSLVSLIVDSLKANDLDDETVQMFREFTNACMYIPDKISNCSVKALTDEHLKYIESIKWEFKTNLVEGIKQASQTAHDKMSAKSIGGPNLKIVAELVSAGRNVDMDGKRSMIEVIMNWVESLEPFDEQWRQIMHRLFQEPTQLGYQVQESLITTVFTTARSDKALQRCIETSHLTGTLKRVVMVKLPFQRILKIRSIRILVNFIHQTSETLAIELLETALKLWSDSSFAAKAPEGQERHLVRMIVHLIYLLTKNEETSRKVAWRDLLLLSMNGVYGRMEMLPLHIQSALFLNETLTKLAFENLPEDIEEAPPVPKTENFSENKMGAAWVEEMKNIRENGLDERKGKPSYKKMVENTENKSSGDEEYVERIGEQEGKFRLFDEGARPPGINILGGYSQREPSAPDGSEEEASDDEEDITNAQRLQQVIILNEPRAAPAPNPNAGVDSDDDEDFPTYSVPETEKKFKKMEVGEEPKHRVEPPAYIADAFEMLLEKEKYEVFEAAFFSLKSLIDRRAVGFPQIAEKLFVRVIFLQNVFGTKKFDETCDAIAVSCIVQRPEIVPGLVRLIISPGQGIRFQQRLLHYIHMAADEMGVLDRRCEEFIMTQENTMSMHFTSSGGPRTAGAGEFANRAEGQPMIPEWQRVIAARVAAKTRRIGTTRQRPEAGVVNRLAKVAKYMFYPLLILPRGEHANLLSTNSDLLAYIVLVASMVYVRSGVNTSIHTMSRELITYVAPYRYSENGKLRVACLAAHLNVMALLPGHILGDIFDMEVRREWMTWCEGIMSAQIGPCVEWDMAHQLLEHLLNHFQEYHPSALLTHSQNFSL
ncbi:hypothetical protein GCK72_009007 [Caenorhabditis remanei]|uniref:Telomere length regulation protein conserved domain-containing protein n=1 Tax=Caenorhabditis remanei TaxID=31234 RepID=A0A6A5H0G0_CAERE|nr:hypothetical protein GCK72_009007 [Caenorhabditis remanei]KAF1760757.1 hypothetical protein GCK72_009007 [Caenorhabditis remanei]